MQTYTIKNPTSRAIENVKIFGETYSIEAEGKLENIPEAIARYWQENLHKFLVIRKEDKVEVEKEEIPQPKVVEEVKEEVAPEVIEPEAVEEVKEEEVVEKPKSSLVSKLRGKKK
jgi:hypothetical protein